MSSRYYLPVRHDVIAKYFYETIRGKNHPECKIEYKGNEFIDQDSGTEYWWNVAIKTAAKYGKTGNPGYSEQKLSNHRVQLSRGCKCNKKKQQRNLKTMVL